jgi:hypothetical protein
MVAWRFARWPCSCIAFLSGKHLLASQGVNTVRKEAQMVYIAASIVILLIGLLAGADLFLDQYNPDELSKMGIEHK